MKKLLSSSSSSSSSQLLTKGFYSSKNTLLNNKIAAIGGSFIRQFSTNSIQSVEEKDKQYSNTIILPKTEFKSKISVDEEVKLQEICCEYAYNNQSNFSKSFTLHDGPPYANGDLHTGHALNKILKDITNRYKLLTGHNIKYIPGWDCHGLPIEMKVIASKKHSLNRRDVGVRKLAKEFAQQAIQSQMKDFKRWGVMGDWNNYYTTMEPKFEAQQLRVFLKMLKDGYIFRGKKPVFWSPSSGTALAESELEYPDVHISKSCYVLFPIESNLFAVVWTTTPWTLFSNEAISFNENIEYSIILDNDTNRRLIIASDLLDSVCSKTNIKNYTLIERKKGKDLFASNDLNNKEKINSYQNPLTLSVTTNRLPFLNGSHVTTEVGTGLVHTAPNHGMEDFQVVKENKLSIGPCMVDENGKFTDNVPIKEFVGLSVIGNGNDKVVELLEGELSNYLLLKENYSHRYPYDWRTKKPIIIRMTEQWFAELKNLKTIAKECIDEKIEMIPSSGRNRLKAFVDSRDEWCISRQRMWGCPIPVFYKEGNSTEYLAAEDNIEHVIGLVEKYGTDCWFEMSDEELLAPKYRGQGWKKGLDTLDVWFDSGTTWFGVMEASGISLPVDVYLEGSDQHRGWFQSSLLTSLAYQGIPPYKKIVTHGFIIDESGKKMSKSLGNVVEPESIVSKHGIDSLRLWVCFSDFSVDLSIGKSVMEKTSNSLKKIRNTAKYLLGVLQDYNPQSYDVKFNENLLEIDYYMIGRLKRFCDQITEAYEDFNYYKVNQLLTMFTYEISSFYLDIIKDRLYCSDEAHRRPCQRVIQYLLDCYTKAIAPIICHTAEDIYKHIPYKQKKSIFEEGWFIPPEQYFTDIKLPPFEAIEQNWNHIIQLRQEVCKVIEKGREDKVFRTTNEVKVNIEYVESDQLKSAIEPLLKSYSKIDKIATQLDDVMNVSKVNWLTGELPQEERLYAYEYKTSDEKVVKVSISKATSHKCPRCWRYASEKENTVCGRCANVLHN
ncbi:hypothetical protein ABK040_000181 [Willaertia magna]